MRHLYLPLDPTFPIHAPYANRLHCPDAKPALYMHDHASLELGLCRRGSGIFYIGSAICPFSQGDLSVIAPGTFHIAQSNPDDVSGWQFIDVDIKALLAGSESECVAARACLVNGVFQDDWLRALVERTLTLFRAHPEGLPEVARCEVRLTAALVAHELNRLAPAQSPAAPRLEAVSPAVVYISRCYDREMTIDELAQMCNLSVSGFRRAFTRAMGSAPFEYLYDVRVKSAMTLLRTTALSIAEIAGRVGYQSLSSFNRHFLRIARTSPSRFRKDARGA